MGGDGAGYGVELRVQRARAHDVRVAEVRGGVGAGVGAWGGASGVEGEGRGEVEIVEIGVGGGAADVGVVGLGAGGDGGLMGAVEVRHCDVFVIPGFYIYYCVFGRRFMCGFEETRSLKAVGLSER